jgi:hypothetical protein
VLGAITIRTKLLCAAAVFAAALVLAFRANSLHTERMALEAAWSNGLPSSSLQGGKPALAKVKPGFHTPHALTSLSTNQVSADLLAIASKQSVTAGAITVAATPVNGAGVRDKAMIGATLSGSYTQIKAVLADLTANTPGLALDRVVLERLPEPGQIKADVQWTLYAQAPEQSTPATQANVVRERARSVP